MILAELVRRGRGERILVVTPRHVLEQMQFELWTRFALPFVRLDSVGIQRIRQKLPANRNPFAYFKRAIVSIDTLKSDRYLAHLEKQHWDAVVIDESHNVTNDSTQNNRLARLLSQPHRRPDPGQRDPAQRQGGVLRRAHPDARAERRHPGRRAGRGRGASGSSSAATGTAPRSRASSAPTGPSGWSPTTSWSTPTPIENEIARRARADLAAPRGRRVAVLRGEDATLFPWTLAKAFLSSPAALESTVRERLKRLDTDCRRAGCARGRGAATCSLGLAERNLSEGSAKYDALVDHLAGDRRRPQAARRGS